MRFSSVFQFPLSQPMVAQPREAAPVEQLPQAPTPAVAPDLPDDLDQRVRMIGEWQLGEG